MGAKIDKKIGQRIRKKREGMKMTREELAERTSVGCSSLAAIELGTRNISSQLLVKVCRALGVSSDAILFGESKQGKYEHLCSIVQDFNQNQLHDAEAMLEIYANAVKK